MNKSKKGFISMTLVYSFLIIFLFLMLAILNTYLQKDKFMEAISNQIDEDIANSQGIRSSVLGKILEENTPYSKDHYYQFNVSNRGVSNGNGLYYSDDIKFTDENNDGASKRIYFFRGEIESNHLIFADLCWRIVRTNEDGTIRIMYNGTPSGTYPNRKCKTMIESLNANNGGHSSRSIATAKFNDDASQEKNLGYVNVGEEDLGDQNDQSNIKRILENWYLNNFINKENETTHTPYANSISGAIYCNDRNYGVKKITPSYIDDSNHDMYNTSNIKSETTLVCQGVKDGSGVYTRDDRFNQVGDYNGNQLMMYPIGLLTAQDVAIAGGYLTSDTDDYNGGFNGIENRGYYMYTNSKYWTMSPYEYKDGIAYMVYVDENGTMRKGRIDQAMDIIPVITLKSNIIIKTGNGFPTTPFELR